MALKIDTEWKIATADEDGNAVTINKTADGFVYFKADGCNLTIAQARDLFTRALSDLNGDFAVS